MSDPSDPDAPEPQRPPPRGLGDLSRRRAKRIVVQPEDVTQPDRRPWRHTSLLQAMLPFLAISAVLVALGVAAFLVVEGLKG